jgi:hypothetical protein
VFVWPVAKFSVLVGSNVSTKQTISIFSSEAGQAIEVVTTGPQHDATTQKRNYFYSCWSHIHQSHRSLPHRLVAGTTTVKTRLLCIQPLLAERKTATCFETLPKHPAYLASCYKERTETRLATRSCEMLYTYRKCLGNAKFVDRICNRHSENNFRLE